MHPKKKHSYAAPFLVIGIIAVFFALHYTRIANEVNGVNQSTGGAINIGSSGGAESLDILMAAFEELLTKPFYLKGLTLRSALIPCLVAVAVVGLYYFIRQSEHELRKTEGNNIQGGSSKWFDDYKGWNEHYVTPYTKEDKKTGLPDPNIILAKDIELSMNSKAIRRNANICVIGGSGTGKTFGFIKPNLAQMNCSYVITDPSGEIMSSMGVMLQKNGYKLKLFSVSDMKHTNVYNPLDYIYDENGMPDQTKIQVLVSTFIQNSSDPKAKGGDQFWTKAETLFLMFAILYLCEFCNVEDRNFYNVMKLTQMGAKDEDSSSSPSALDSMVENARDSNPKAKCLVFYKSFQLNPPRTMNSVLTTVATDLELFAADDVRNMTTTGYLCKRDRNGVITEYIRDENGDVIRDSTNIDLESIGDEKTALFVNIPQANGAFNFLIAMMYSQLFDQLYSHAEKICPNRFHIYDQQGIAISSQYHDEKEAQKVITAYCGASVKTDKDKNGVERYYIYNKKAKDLTIPEKAQQRQYGYLREVYNVQCGQDLIERYKHSTIKRGALRLPIHVRFLLDEFANIGRIPDFDKKLATMRKYEISTTIILQSISQLKDMYDKAWEGIIGNCDTMVFLGSSEMETSKYVSDKLGKTTIKTSSYSMQKNGGSDSYQLKSRNLLDPSEVTTMDNDECILFVRGENPFCVKKYKFTDHPNFDQSADKIKNEAIGIEYLDKHFRCLPKELNIDDDMQSQEDAAENVMNGKMPDGTGREVGGDINPVNTFEDIAAQAGSSMSEMREAMSEEHQSSDIYGEQADPGNYKNQKADNPESYSFTFQSTKQ